MSSNSHFCEDYFQEVNTKEKAYWLGFLFADGSIVSNRVGLCLSSKDLIQIEKFCDTIGLDKNNIKHRIRKCRNKSYNTSELFVKSKKMVHDLGNYGCIAKKSLRLKFPLLEREDLYMAFILGYYDGDGCSGSSVICSGCLDFLTDVKRYFCIKYSPKLKLNPYGQCYVLSLGRKLVRKLLLNFDYGIERKRFFKDKNIKRHWSIKPNYHGGGGNRKKIIVCPFTKDELQGFVINLSLKNIGKPKGFSEKIVARWCKDFNIIVPSSKQKSIARRKFVVDKEELKCLMEKNPMVKIGRMYGVSDNAIRKRAKLFGLL